MPSADRVPTNTSHSRMPWHMWVVLIAGSTGSALRAVPPPNLPITPVARPDLVYRASATGSLYRSPLTIMAQTIRAILLASAIAATLVGRARAAVWCHGSWRTTLTLSRPGRPPADFILSRKVCRGICYDVDPDEVSAVQPDDD